MAEFLTTTGVSHHLEILVRKSKKELYLISPYLQINSQLKHFINENASQEIKIIYGKKEKLNHIDMNWIMGNPKISLYYLDNLHAKCYISEDYGIVTSMNLFEFSQVSNVEMGVLVNVKQDFNFYNSIMVEVKAIERRANLIKKSTLDSTISNSTTMNIFSGYCIRTGKQIPFNPKKPLSDNAFYSWANFGDEDYPEKYCHFSGEKSYGETSYSKPILRKNWKEAMAKNHR